MDVFTKEKRSEVMSNIKNQDTKYEILMRKMLFAKGYRFRKNLKTLPGSPDIVLRKYKLVIFIHGCFWHGHTSCPLFRLPKSNEIFWKNKIYSNQLRDRKSIWKLRKQGWRVVVVWECKLRKNILKQFNRIERIIKKIELVHL
jgi:DNA mismatch endonuclease (patch repair protein)